MTCVDMNATLSIVGNQGSSIQLYASNNCMWIYTKILNSKTNINNITYVYNFCKGHTLEAGIPLAVASVVLIDRATMSQLC